MLRKDDLDELLNDGILVDGTDDDLVCIGTLYKIADGYEMFALCEDDNEWQKIVDISYKHETKELYISNENYWLEDIIKIKIVGVVKIYE